MTADEWLDDRDRSSALCCAEQRITDLERQLAELARTKRALEIARDALLHYANPDNWLDSRYRGTIHGPAVAEESLAAIADQNAEIYKLNVDMRRLVG